MQFLPSPLSYLVHRMTVWPSGFPITLSWYAWRKGLHLGTTWARPDSFLAAANVVSTRHSNQSWSVSAAEKWEGRFDLYHIFALPNVRAVKELLLFHQTGHLSLPGLFSLLCSFYWSNSFVGLLKNPITTHSSWVFHNFFTSDEKKYYNGA